MQDTTVENGVQLVCHSVASDSGSPVCGILGLNYSPPAFAGPYYGYNTLCNAAYSWSTNSSCDPKCKVVTVSYYFTFTGGSETEKLDCVLSFWPLPNNVGHKKCQSKAYKHWRRSLKWHWSFLTWQLVVNLQATGQSSAGLIDPHLSSTHESGWVPHCTMHVWNCR